jgi:hypothetical protein
MDVLDFDLDFNGSTRGSNIVSPIEGDQLTGQQSRDRKPFDRA